ncbi:MAG: family 78 glycoside hydrolase catalytic domain [Bacteroidales bacterium]|nr:family 78 glycoside hydrolase catalytic domain [Bacteroidales bacterium]
MKYSLSLLLVAVLTLQAQAAIHVTNLSVEGRKDQPLGLDVETPRLGWQIVADAGEQDVVQTSYHILVASSPELMAKGQGDLWDASVASPQSLWIDYLGTPLKPNQRAYWKVQVTCERAKGKKTVSEQSDWSDISTWGAGLLNDGNWRGNWIGFDYAMPWDVENEHSQLSARYYRTTFQTQGKQIRHATLHIAGLGLYEAFVNGQRVGDVPDSKNHLGQQVLMPAPTDYRRSIIYNSFDVTPYLLPSNPSNLSNPSNSSNPSNLSHCLAVTVSNGRYYTMQQKKKLYKIANFGYPTLRANLIIEYTDGTSDIIATNEKNWRITADGPIRSSNEYDGEIYDASKAFENWTMADFDDSQWSRPDRSALPIGKLRGNTTPPMVVQELLFPRDTRITEDGRILFDFGQNFAGWMRVPVGLMGLNKGDTLRLRFAEKLEAPIGAPWTEEESWNSNGPGYCLTDTSRLYVENLRNALVTDYYIANGNEDEDETWAPRFTYHGFRFAEVEILRNANPDYTVKKRIKPRNGNTTPLLALLNSSNPSNPSNPSNSSNLSNLLVGEVVGDPMETLYTFETPNPVLNRVVRNAFWGVRSNYKGMPVDCPQRDERQPWVGDHSMGCWGESYLMDNHALYLKWMQDLEDSQRPDGTLPGVSPAFWNYYNDDITWPSVFIFGADMLYTQFGDIEAIRRHYPAMRRWVMHFWENHRDPKTGVIKADKYADWCCPPEAPELIHSQDPNRVTDGVLIGSCYLYRIFQDMMKFDDILIQELQGCSTAERLAMNRQGLTIELLETDKAEYQACRTSLRDAINGEFLNVKTSADDPKAGRTPSSMTGPGNHILYPDSVFYSNNSVTANLLPWAFGIVPDEHAATVERWIMRKHLLLPGDTPELRGIDGHIQCGVIGMSWLLRGLADMGRQDLAWMLATVKSYPGWGYMALHGATTIWELWNGDTANPRMNSGNHIMLLGDLIPWCMENVGGIKAAAPGFSTISFAPNFEVEELDEASASYKTPYGLVASHWQKTDRQLIWDITIPCNATGKVTLPYNVVLKNSRSNPSTQSSQSTQSTPSNSKTLTLGSGTHHLVFDLDPALPVRDYYKGGAYERQYADSLSRDRQGIVCDQFVYDFQNAAHPSCHSASIAELRNGDLLGTFFLGAREGAPDVCIYTSRKPKGSDQWEPLQLVANGDLRPGAKPFGTEIDSTLTTPIEDNVNRKACYNPVLFQIPGGDLLLFYKIGKNVRDWTGYIMRSSDNGYTWSDPRQELVTASNPALSPQLSPVQSSDSLLGAIKNQPIYLPKGFRCANGTVLQKARILSPSSKETGTASKEKSGQWRSYIEMSEDDGHTWALYGPVPDEPKIGTIQPALLVHKDGRIQMLCRTHRPKDSESHLARIATAFSEDGGLTWGPMQLLDDVPNNNSGIDAVTLPDGTFALVYNPFSLVPGPDKPLRNPTCIATSSDGITWTHRLTLESSPISQYSYPSLLLGSDNTLHAIYTWRRQGIKYQQIKLK